MIPYLYVVQLCKPLHTYAGISIATLDNYIETPAYTK